MSAGPSRPRGPYRNGVRTRQEIVGAAARAFAERGYNGASMRQIAAAVGVSPAALLRHFENKEDLLTAVLRWWAETTAHLHAEHLEGLEKLEALRGLMPYHVEHRGLLELFLTISAEASSATYPARPFVQNRYAEQVEFQTAALLEAADLGQVAPLDRPIAQEEIQVLVAVMDGLELQWLLDASVDLVGIFDRHLDRTIARWKAGAYR